MREREREMKFSGIVKLCSGKIETRRMTERAWLGSKESEMWKIKIFSSEKLSTSHEILNRKSQQQLYFFGLKHKTDNSTFGMESWFSTDNEMSSHCELDIFFFARQINVEQLTSTSEQQRDVVMMLHCCTTTKNDNLISYFSISLYFHPNFL